MMRFVLAHARNAANRIVLRLVVGHVGERPNARFAVHRRRRTAARRILRSGRFAHQRLELHRMVHRIASTSARTHHPGSRHIHAHVRRTRITAVQMMMAIAQPPPIFARIAIVARRRSRTLHAAHHAATGRMPTAAHLHATIQTLIVVIVVIVIVADVRIVVVHPVLWFPRHFVLLLQASAGVREPRRNLRQRHLGDDREHDFLAFGRVRVLFVLVQPRLEDARCFAGGVLAAGSVQFHAVAVWGWWKRDGRDR